MADPVSYLLLDPATRLGAVGVLSVSLVAVAGYHVKSATKWAKERAALLEASRVEREKLLADARAERAALEREIAAERTQVAAVYERRVQDQKDAAERMFEQNAGWMDLVGDVGKVLTVLNERVALLGTGKR